MFLRVSRFGGENLQAYTIECITYPEQLSRKNHLLNYLNFHYYCVCGPTDAELNQLHVRFTVIIT